MIKIYLVKIMLGFSIKKFRQASLVVAVLLTGVCYANADNIAVAYADDNMAVAYANEPEVFVGHQSSEHTAQNLARCSQHFYGGVPPALVGEKGKKLARENYELCFDGFAVLYSGISKTPIYSAEYLTKNRILSARTLTRKDGFHEETRLPSSARATLNDYRRSGYDRGHLSPNGDMSNASEQFDSFSLANIAPQNNEHNRGVWQSIEKSVRNMAVTHHEVYVVTGVVFDGKKVASIGSGVLVPSHFFKAVYIPSLGRAGVYYSANSASGEVEYIGLDQFTQRTGISVMPYLSQDISHAPFNLPDLSDMNDGRSSQNPSYQTSQDGGWLGVLIKSIIEFVMAFLRGHG